MDDKFTRCKDSDLEEQWLKNPLCQDVEETSQKDIFGTCEWF